MEDHVQDLPSAPVSVPHRQRRPGVSHGLLSPADVCVEETFVGAVNPARLQTRVDGFALECEDAEDAFVNSIQRLALDEAIQRLDAERELSKH